MKSKTNLRETALWRIIARFIAVSLIIGFLLNEYFPLTAVRVLASFYGSNLMFEGDPLASEAVYSAQVLSAPPSHVEILHRAVLMLIPRLTSKTKPFSRNASCSLVGSSSNLNMRGLGSQIDSNDIVIRLNDAPTVGYERDVGSRTDVRIMNWRTFPGEELQPHSSHLITYWVGSSMHDRLRDKLVQKRNFLTAFESVSIIDPAFLDWVSGLLSSPPSTGIFATFLAQILCGRTEVFGMGPGIDGLWSHYYPRPGISPSFGLSVHSHRSEAQALWALEWIGRVRVVR